jgi:hypothetical protein
MRKKYPAPNNTWTVFLNGGGFHWFEALFEVGWTMKNLSIDPWKGRIEEATVELASSWRTRL